MTAIAEALLEADGISKSYGGLQALDDVSIRVEGGRVTCLLGDNGAGKSTLIKVLSGAVRPDGGSLRVGGKTVAMRSPRDALALGIATVYQDLAVVGIMPVYRNFFLGQEPVRGHGPFGWFSTRRARAIAGQELARMGIEVDDLRRPIETLSGGQRQCVAIARAVYHGARVLILDEPTSALGVRESQMVLSHVKRARSEGIGVVLITHNVHHAFPVGDSFVVLRRGRMEMKAEKAELTEAGLERAMAGGAELDRLQAQLGEGK